MTVAAPELGLMPNGRIYQSKFGRLFEFQETGVALAYLLMEERSAGTFAAWDTGTGKTHLAMALAALLYEDSMVDVVLLVAEKGKVGDWVQDFSSSTSLDVRLHHGSSRLRKLSQQGLPRVLVSTYETIKADSTTFVKKAGKRGTSMEDGPLLEVLRGKNVLVVYDEVAKLRNRSSANYKAHFRMLTQLRKAGITRVLGLTATPIERDFEDAFNQGRIISPESMPTVDQFERTYVRARDVYGRPQYQQHLMHEFAALFRPFMHRVRKTDPEVMKEFPSQVEESTHVEMSADQKALYEACEELGEEHLSENDEPMPGLWTVLRQIAGHPGSLTLSQGALATQLVEAFGADWLRGVTSTKTDSLVSYLDPIIEGQGDKAVVFTFFGQSILPMLHKALREKGWKVYLNHGAMSVNDQMASRTGFKDDPKPSIFLTSDAGARGLNLPEALYVVNYELPLTHANYTQRINRIHRIDSTHASVTCQSFIVKDSVEEFIANKMMDRNEWQDTLLGDDDAGEGFITAADRREMLNIARKSKGRR